MLRRSVALLRLVAACLHGVRGLLLIRLCFPGWTAAQRDACILRWTRTMLRIVNVSLAIEGELPGAAPLLLVANHVSWVDVLVMQAAHRTAFVSKSEIRAWPLIGPMAAGVGTLFIERTVRRDALRTVHSMAEALRGGAVITVFPEGTTTEGSSVGPFHANLLQAAIDADVAVQPVGIRFVDAASGQRSHAVDYVGDDTMMQSVWRTLCAPPIRAVVRFGLPGAAAGRDRRAWARDLQGQVSALIRRTATR